MKYYGGNNNHTGNSWYHAQSLDVEETLLIGSENGVL